MKKDIIKNLLFFTFLLIAILGWFVSFFLQGRESLSLADREIMSSYEILNAAQLLSNKPYGVLATSRSYFLTHDPSFLDDYRKEKAELFKQMATLSNMVKLDPSLMESVNLIQADLGRFIIVLEGSRIPVEGESLSTVLNDDTDKIETSRQVLDDRINAFISSVQRVIGQHQIEMVGARNTYYFNLIIFGLLGGGLLISFNGFLFYAQFKRLQAEEMLRTSARRFELAITGSSDGIFDLNAAEQRIYYTRQFYSILGLPESSEGILINDLKRLVHPDDQEAFSERLQASLTNQTSEYADTYRLKHAEGRWIWVNSRGRVIRDHRNRVERIVGGTSDITYMRIYQEKVEAEKDAALRADKAKSAFLAHISHEIRTPLTAIVGVADIMKAKQDNLTDKQKKLVDVLRVSAISLRELLTGILDFSRIESGALVLDERRVNLMELIKEVESIASVSAQEKHLKLVTNLDEIKGITAWLDPVRLRQILVNLVGNAVKFTATGFVELSASVTMLSGTQFIKIEVKDTGIGISEDKQKTIFERFVQANSDISTRFGGTGLGLSISRDLAKLMGGSIKVESKMGEGSTFTLFLPLLHAPDDSSAAHEKDIANQNTINKKMEDKHRDRLRAIAAGEKRVLLAEDYEGNIIIISSLLEDAGLVCDIAHDGLEAIEKWNQRHYDVVLMDIKMPKMDGFAAATEIRRLEAVEGVARTPIICMTAHAMLTTQEKHEEVGMDGFLSKPVTSDELLSALEKVMNIYA